MGAEWKWGCCRGGWGGRVGEDSWAESAPSSPVRIHEAWRQQVGVQEATRQQGKDKFGEMSHTSWVWGTRRQSRGVRQGSNIKSAWHIFDQQAKRVEGLRPTSLAIWGQLRTYKVDETTRDWHQGDIIISQTNKPNKEQIKSQDTRAWKQTKSGKYKFSTPPCSSLSFLFWLLTLY